MSWQHAREIVDAIVRDLVCVSDWNSQDLVYRGEVRAKWERIVMDHLESSPARAIDSYEVAVRAVEAIVRDLTTRPDLGNAWFTLYAGTQAQIRADWRNVVNMQIAQMAAPATAAISGAEADVRDEVAMLVFAIGSPHLLAETDAIRSFDAADAFMAERARRRGTP